jgi:chemotaxis protein CheX
MEKYIQAFIDVTNNVFKELLHTDIEVQRPYFSDQTSFPSWDVSGVIGITGEASGALVISMKKDVAMKITGTLTGTDHNKFDEEVTDSVGEIINIIAGNVKHNFEQEFRLVISLPTVICGSNHTIQWPYVNTRIICIPFKVFYGDSFYLSVAIEVLGGGSVNG